MTDKQWVLIPSLSERSIALSKLCRQKKWDIAAIKASLMAHGIPESDAHAYASFALNERDEKPFTANELLTEAQRDGIGYCVDGNLAAPVVMLGDPRRLS